MATFQKDKDSTLDYQVDWAAWLGTDTIVTSNWIVPSGITSSSPANTTTTATIWLAGGTVGETYRVVNRIITAGGRTNDRSLFIQVTDL